MELEGREMRQPFLILTAWLVRRLEWFSGTANFDSSKDSLWAEFLRTITNTVKQEICGTDEITLSDKVEKG